VDLLPERLLTCKEVAALFGVSVHAVYDWSAGGTTVPVGGGQRRRVRLQATPIPSGLRFTAADVEAFLERCRELREQHVGRGEAGTAGGGRVRLRWWAGKAVATISGAPLFPALPRGREGDVPVPAGGPRGLEGRGRWRRSGQRGGEAMVA
jgi:hypothetical protein